MSKLILSSLILSSLAVSCILSQPLNNDDGNPINRGYGQQSGGAPPGNGPVERARNGARRGWSPTGPGPSSPPSPQHSPSAGANPEYGGGGAPGPSGRRRRRPGQRRGRHGSPGGFGGAGGAPARQGGYSSGGGGGSGYGPGSGNQGSGMGPRIGGGPPPSVPDLAGRRMNSPPRGNYEHDVDHSIGGQSGPRSGQRGWSPTAGRGGGGSPGSFEPASHGQTGQNQGGLSAVNRRTFNPFSTA